jgi:effector-binding domain-containing protein
VIDTPTVVESEARETAVIRLVVPQADIRSVMGPAIQEVMATLAAQGIEPAGPLYDYHRRMDPEVFDFEVGVPVPRRVSPSGRVVEGRLPARSVARTVYHGGYEGLGAAWAELTTWIASRGYVADPDFWQCFLAGPESGPDASKWRTELNRPVRGS